MFAMVKAVVPRYRYDQLMRIGWKVFLPLSLAWVVLVVLPRPFRRLRRGLCPLGGGGLRMRPPITPIPGARHRAPGIQNFARGM